jgi:PEP-CTERM motif
MPIRIKSIAVLSAIIALSTSVSAQTYAFGSTELGRVVPSRFATTTQQLLASVDVAISMPAVAEEAKSEKVDLVSESMPTDNWGGTVVLHESDDAEDEASVTAPSFFQTGMGRASIAGLAGLAGASYFALRSNSPRVASLSVANPPTSAPIGGFTASLPDTPQFTANPEPATMALMAIGMGVLGVVARRRCAV